MGAIIVACPDSGGSGSVASVVRNHVRELARYHEVTLIATTPPQEPISGVRFIQSGTMSFSWLGRLGHVPREVFIAVSAWRQVRQVCRKQSVTALIVHSHAFALWVGQRIRQEFGVPFLLVVHADIHDRPRGTYDRWVTLFYRWVTPIAYRSADRVLAISNDIARAAIRYGGEADRVRIVPNGISLAEIEPDTDLGVPAASPGNTRLRILFVGRLSVEKGVTDLITACNLLMRQAVHFQLQIVGTGPLRCELGRRVSDLGLSDHVSFLGAQPRNRLGAFYRAADVTCVPSLSEPQGIVVLESLLAGTPVVASDVGGIPDMVKDGVNGRLHPPGSPVKAAELLANLAVDRVALARLARAARVSVEERYSWAGIGQRLEAVINEFE